MRRLPALLGLLAASLVPACSEVRPASAPANVGGTAIIGGGEMQLPHPLLFATYWDAESVDLFYPSLVRPQWGHGELLRVGADGSPMALARRWEYVGGDRRVLRYHMRSDARWSDGTPVTARDVLFTFRALKDPRVASPRQNLVETIESVVAQDDSTVTFTFSAPQVDVEQITGHPLAPAHVYEAGDWAQMRRHPAMADPTRMVVFGPFRVARHERGQQTVLERNAAFVPRARLDRIIVRQIPDAVTARLEFRQGNLDRLTTGASGQRELASVPGATFSLTVPKSLLYVGYNPQKFAAFADREIRRAMGLALDVDVLRETIRVTNNTTPAAGPYSPFLAVFDSARMRPLPYDTAAANRIFEARGWRDSDGDGVRDRAGQPFRFELLVNGGQFEVDVAVAAQAMWKRVGVDAQIRQGEGAALASRLRERDYQAVLSGKGVGMSADISNEWMQGSRVGFGYGTPELDARIERARALSDPAAQRRAWQDIAVHLIEEQPITWLWWVSLYEVLGPGLRGVAPTTWSEFDNTHEWYQPPQSRRVYGAPPAAPAPTP